MNAQNLISLLFQRGATLWLEEGELCINAPDGVLDDELLGNLRANKPDLIKLLAALAASDQPTQSVPRQTFAAAYEAPASLAQERMLFVEELAGGSSYYNMPAAFRLEGALNEAALVASLQHLLASHDILRTRHVMKAQSWVQQVDAPGGFELARTDLTGQPEQALQACLQEDANHVFDLAANWPIRVRLIRLGAQTHVLSMNIHHIAADGWSARKIVADLAAGYHASLNPAAVLPQRSYQYADYVAWQTAWRHSPAYAAARQYWGNCLQGAPQLHSVLTDHVRPAVQSVEGATFSYTLDPELAQRIAPAAKAGRTTPFVLLQAVFAAFLARYSGESDIVFGTAAANRQPLEFVNTIGLFVNTLVLRYAVADNITFAALVQQAMTVSDGAFRHQQYPFDELVDQLQPARSLGYNPLVQMMLVMQEDAGATLELDAMAVTPLTQRQSVAKFDIALHVHPKANGMRLDWEYNTSLFRAETIAQMAGDFSTLLQACLDAPGRGIGEIALVAPNPVALAFDDGAFAQPQAVHRLFEAQVKLVPDSIAVREGELQMSYRMLDLRANLLARHLRQIIPEGPARIGVSMEKSVDLIVSMLAIFKVGAVYVPLDPHYPAERLAWMIADTGMTVVLTHAGTSLPEALNQATRIIKVDEAQFQAAACASTEGTDVNWPAPGAILPAAAPAYIIYTSGSTGKPKGVEVSHQALFHSLHANRQLMQITANDSMPTIGSQAFGVSLLEILLPLMSGATVHVLRKAQIADMESLLADTAQVSILHAVPSLMRQWLDAVLANGAAYPQLRLLLVGGEAVPDGLLKAIMQWRPGIRLLELYGMTESTIVCSSYEPVAGVAAHYCIGQPHPGTRFYVLNRQGQRQPVGVPGELHIGGLSIANGYLNQPEITAQKFIPDPWREHGRLYQTGDRVRLLPDGNHEFLGRVDHQVSLRGARIEMGEIEMLAGAVDGVRQAVAHVMPLDADEATLVLYYTVHEASASSADLSQLIRDSLARHLPDYMRPSLIERLDAFPLNPNGKVDRKRLPAIRVSQAPVLAETATEKKLAALWCDVLKLDEVSVTADFFAIGGHSLMATRLATRIRAEFDVQFPLASLFAAPNIRANAKVIEQALLDKYAAALSAPASNREDDEEILI